MGHIKASLFVYIFLWPQINTNASAELPINASNWTFPADMTFLIADLKYNKEQGVKICEIQSGSASVFMGDDFIHNEFGLVGRKLADFLARYQHPIWCVGNVCDKESRTNFIERGWSLITDLEKLHATASFIEAAVSPVEDPGSLFSYHGLLFTKKVSSYEELKVHYPGVLLLDAAVIPYQNDKYAMSQLLNTDERLLALKPAWKIYPKEYSQNLVETILRDFSGDFLVIKPRKSTEGRGVILLHKSALAATLKYIFTVSGSLCRDFDPSYQYWATDSSENFIVEEFIQSDPVRAPHLDNQLYDGTMRMVFILTCHQGNIEVTFLDGHWQLPKNALSEQGTFSQKHKSFGDRPYFLAVHPADICEVEEQLREGLPILYKKMLQKTPVEY